MARNRGRNSRVTPRGTSRTHRNDRGSGEPNQSPSDEDFELLNDVLSALSQPHPVDFLMFVSTLASAVDPRSALQDEVDARIDSLLPVIDAFGEAAQRETQALLVGLSEIAVDVETRRRAEHFVTQFGPREWTRLPVWLQQLRQAKATRALSQSDHGGDWSIEVIELDVAGTLMMSALHIDHTNGRTVNDGYPNDITIDDVLAMTEGNDLDRTVLSEAIEPAESAARWRYAIDVDDMMSYEGETETESDTWPAARPLLEWIIRQAGAAATSSYEEQIDEAEVARLRKRFVESAKGVRAAESRSLGGLDALLFYAANFGSRDPLRWGPARVWNLLVDWFPERVSCPPHEARRFPQLVRAWVRFAHAESGVPAAYTDEVLEAIDSTEPAFLDAAGADDDSPDNAAALAALVDALSGVISPFWNRAEWARQTVTAAVGAQHVDDFDDAPLPDELFDMAGIDPSLHEVLPEWVGGIERCCADLLTLEFRTACFRLLRKIALADPAALRRGKVEFGVLALVWIIASANFMYDNDVRVDGPSAMVKDLTAYFGATSSSHLNRGSTLLKAIGVTRRQYAAVELGDPAFLTSHCRATLRELRDGSAR